MHRPSPRARLSPVKALRGCGVDLTKGATMLDDQDFRDERAEATVASPAAHLLDELQIHGYRPLEEEGDPSPLPSPEAAELALATIFEAATGLFAETRLEPDLPDLLWSLVNLFHRQTERMGRLLDDNEIAQRNSQAQQDGSEVRSVELERLSVSRSSNAAMPSSIFGTARPISSPLRSARGGAPALAP